MHSLQLTIQDDVYAEVLAVLQKFDTNKVQILPAEKLDLNRSSISDVREGVERAKKSGFIDEAAFFQGLDLHTQNS